MTLRAIMTLGFALAAACGAPSPSAAPEADAADMFPDAAVAPDADVAAVEVAPDASETTSGLDDATADSADAAPLDDGALSDAENGDVPDVEAVDAPQTDEAAALDVAPLTACPPTDLPKWATATATPRFWPSLTCATPGWPGLPSAASPTFVDIGMGAWPAVGIVDACVLWEDLDGDGVEDLATISLPLTPSGPRHLQILRHAAAQAEAVTTALPPVGQVRDCVAGDLDGDGLPEIVLAAEVKSVILHNLGAGQFADMTQASGAGGIQDMLAGAVALWDPDRDGDLDIYLAQGIAGVGFSTVESALAADPPYIQACAGPAVPGFDAACAAVKAASMFAFSCCTLIPSGGLGAVLRNDGGKFTDVAAAVGLTDSGNTLALTVADLDGDGWPDIFVGDDFGAHGWYRRTAAGNFKHLTGVLGMRPYGHVMGSLFADLDGDHHGDLLITEAGPTTYYRGLSDDTFANEGGPLGFWQPTQDSLSWAILAADLDQDGWLDVLQLRSEVAVPGGFLAAVQAGVPPVTATGSHLLFHNDGGFFSAVSLAWPAGATQGVQGEAAAVGDVDGDGDLDLITTTAPGILRIYRNDTPTLGHWLRVRVLGGAAAEGAHVQIWAQGYAQERVRTASAGTGSKQSSLLQFGLGNVAVLDRVRITWPSGQQVELKQVAVDQTLTVAPP